MPRKIDSRLIDNAASLVLNGMTFQDAGKQVGVHPITISKLLKKKGIGPPPPRAHNEIKLPIDDIKSMYESGKSENAVAKYFGTDRGTIRKRLIEAGVKPRSHSEAEKLKWSQMDKDTRANQ
ncbi:MAG: hypothetical protein RI591_07925, partial [Dehalococcoidia bacterium]|nr:hypothetical protein [Dehalococcoidia bacterium]